VTDAAGAYRVAGALLARPETHGLLPSFPNPFNPATVIPYRLDDAGPVRLAIYDILGQRVRTLVDGSLQSPGVYQVRWDGHDDHGIAVGTGVYVVHLQGPGLRDSRKITLLDGPVGPAPMAAGNDAREPQATTATVTVSAAGLASWRWTDVTVGSGARRDFRLDQAPVPAAKPAGCAPGTMVDGDIVLGYSGDECLVMEAVDRAECRASDGYQECVKQPEADYLCGGDWRLPSKAESLMMWDQRGPGAPVSAHDMCVAANGECTASGILVPHTYWTSAPGLALDRGTVIAGSVSIKRSARCVRTVGPPVVTESAKLVTDLGAAGDGFGRAVAVSDDGTLLVAGSVRHDKNGADAGAAFVYRWDGQAWQEGDRLLAADGASNAHFGASVAISGDGRLIAVGATGAGQQGAVYLFRNLGSHWLQVARRVPTDAAAWDQVGTSVALSHDGERLAVGALHGDEGATNAGAVYLFERQDDAWPEIAAIAAADPVKYDSFGASLAFDEDGGLLAVGAPGDDDGGTSAGAVYLFDVGDGGAWTPVAELSGGGAGDGLGISTALAHDGQTLVAGAADGNQARVYTRAGGAWQQDEVLTADDAQPGYAFGTSVAITADGGTIGVGAPNAVAAGAPGGKVYRFEPVAGDWVQTWLLASDAKPGDAFGFGVDVAADAATVVAGALGDDDQGPASGSAYVYGTPAADVSAPSAVVDVAAAEVVHADRIELAWTAPGDDGSAGRAAAYEVGLSASGAIDDDDACGQATAYPQQLVPASAGATESLTVAGLQRDTDYAFCVRAVDDAGNRGSWQGPAVSAATLPFSLRLPFPEGDSYPIGWAYGDGGHTGCGDGFSVDFTMPLGSEVVAAASGRVVMAYDHYVDYVDASCSSAYENRGNRVIIDHGSGRYTIYLHLKQDGAAVEPGDYVQAGQLIGYSGNTGKICPGPDDDGDHLHFAVHSWDGSLCSQPYPFSDSGVAGLPEGGGIVVSENDGSTDFLGTYVESVAHPTQLFAPASGFVALEASTEMELFVSDTYDFEISGTRLSWQSWVVVFLFSAGSPDAIETTAVYYPRWQDDDFSLTYPVPSSVAPGGYCLGMALSSTQGGGYSTPGCLPIVVE
jgi:murein DD-endopeptidase MepM/ murein hydrolase activator NlpD